ncbi:hypothetical protein TNCV_2776111 [Trichonephila clavipes]|nr:hypothetical protein TNCV_2776111 [Trichonephila clavipes]
MVAKNGFHLCFQKLYERWQKCIVAQGDYFEGGYASVPWTIQGRTRSKRNGKRRKKQKYIRKIYTKSNSGSQRYDNSVARPSSKQSELSRIFQLQLGERL